MPASKSGKLACGWRIPTQAAMAGIAVWSKKELLHPFIYTSKN